MKNLWHKIEKRLDIDTYEGWMRNGLSFVVGCFILIFGSIIGITILIMKCLGKL